MVDAGRVNFPCVAHHSWGQLKEYDFWDGMTLNWVQNTLKISKSPSRRLPFECRVDFFQGANTGRVCSWLGSSAPKNNMLPSQSDHIDLWMAFPFAIAKMIGTGLGGTWAPRHEHKTTQPRGCDKKSTHVPSAGVVQGAPVKERGVQQAARQAVSSSTSIRITTSGAMLPGLLGSFRGAQRGVTGGDSEDPRCLAPRFFRVCP